MPRVLFLGARKTVFSTCVHGLQLWAPPDSGSAHRRIAGLYRVPDSRPEAVPCAALAFPSLRRFLTRRTCLLAPGKNSAADEITMLRVLERRRELGQKRAGRVLFQPLHHEQLRQLAEIVIGI